MSAGPEQTETGRRSRVVAVTLVTAGALLAGVMMPVGAMAATPSPAPSTTTAPKPKPVACKAPVAPKAAKPYAKFYRPVTKYGDRDLSPKKIKHVREAQYRLRWAGFYKGKVTGAYWAQTRDAVKAFQKKYCLPQTGNLNRAAWALLIQKTTSLSRIPATCKKKGWNLCYDRKKHKTYLFKSGVLQNVWLVRGGSKSAKTRKGTYTVYARHSYKISTLYHVPMWNFLKHSGGQGHHGSGFMMDPFVGHSHGCINMYIPDSKVLYKTVKGKKVRVTVFGAWS